MRVLLRVVFLFMLLLAGCNDADVNVSTKPVPDPVLDPVPDPDLHPGPGPDPDLNPGPIPDPDLTPGPASDPYAAARMAVVERINSYRVSIGLWPLAHWAQIDACSDAQAQRDAALNRIHASFGDCDESAQNECARFQNIESILGCLDYMWNEGPGEDWSQHGHYINMSNPAYTKVSIGFHTTPEGKIWCVQNFSSDQSGIPEPKRHPHGVVGEDP